MHKHICNIILVCVALYHQGHCDDVMHDAAIFPGNEPSGLKVQYSNVGDFSNLPLLAKDEGFLSIGTICINKGAFILYRNPKYDIASPDDFRIASGDQKCFKASEIGSAQPIGPIAYPKQDSISFFSRPNFASAVHPTPRKISRKFFNSLKRPVKSLIIIGKTGWTIKTFNGKKFCLLPDFDEAEKTPICVLPDFRATKISKRGLQIAAVSKGCSNSSTSTITINVNFCNHWGVVPELFGKVKALALGDGMEGRSNADMCSGVGDAADHFKDTIKLFKAVLTSSFDEIINLAWESMGKSKWKLELLDVVFEIANAAIPDELVETYYLNRIRELFVYNLAKAWARIQTEVEGGAGEHTGSATMGLLSDYDYRRMLLQTNDCLQRVVSSDTDTLAEKVAAWYELKDPTMMESLVWKGLARRKENNLIIELTWVIANMVGGICHMQFGYAHNFWALYIHLINQMYLIPVIPEWKVKMDAIDMLLGGDTNVQHTKIAMVASLYMYEAHSLEPFERPRKPEPREDNNEIKEPKE